MTKSSAFGTTLSIGVRQVETATIVGTITTSGDANVITTAAGVTGSAITTVVAVLENDTADMIAAKIRTALLAETNLVAKYAVGGSGPYVTLTRLIAAANDTTLNINVADDSSAGITEDTTSDATAAGVLSVSIAQVTNIGGPGLSLDTEDVTTHDSTDAFEQVVATILRSGEVSLDIVYDPAGATHTILWGYLGNQTQVFCDLDFIGGAVHWYFPAYVTGFEPGAPMDGALTAAVKLKIDGKPTLS